MTKKMYKFIHKIYRKLQPKMQLMAFIPWVLFWNQEATNPSSKVIDKATLQIGLGSDCKSITKKFKVTVARSPEARSRGLSYRTQRLAKDEGMLFIFTPPELVGFWMKHTLIPLQIGYFDEKGVLVKSMAMHVEDDPKNPQARYLSEREIQIALEVAPRMLNEFPINRTVLCVDK